MHARSLLRLWLLPEVLVALTLFAQGQGSAAAAYSRPAIDSTSAAAGSSIAPEDIGAHIAAIQGARSGLGSEAQRAKLNEVAAYVHDHLAGYGLSVTEDPVTVSGQTFPNIVGTLSGTTCPEKTFIVGTHYDSVGVSPGADDNASGVAATLEIARLLSGQSFQASVDFVAFSFEESGMVGSSQMATAAKSAGRDLLGMFSLEMIGYTCDVPGCQLYPPGIPPQQPTGDYIAVIGNANSDSLLSSFTGASATAVPSLPVLPYEVPGNGETLPDVRRSDHAPFWDEGYQALLITDTSNFRNPNYHHASDTLDTLDLAFAADVANAALATVVQTLTADQNGDGVADVCGPPPVAGVAEDSHLQPPGTAAADGSSRSDSIRLAAAAAAAAAVGALAVATGVRLARRRRRP